MYRGSWVATVLVTLSLAFSMAASTGWAAKNAGPLPDIPGWDSGDLATEEYETPTEQLGCRMERLYRRQADNHSILVVWVRGPGTLWQGFPEGEVSADDGPIGSGATYNTLDIDDHRAVLECHPLVGKALSVAIAPDFTLTFETTFADVGLDAFALVFLEQLGDRGER
ncbi:MAG TPA: hypothetical protein PLM30_02650 [Synergistales bacterium]|nr:hypothetical protein [Synergistales bacterium]